ncbi:MAG TPA: hypothetical protein VI854_10450, partial [Acidimicrobiia bacterium]|nr:hypothetical protein [Acidimicrobiia bacterium]
MARTWTTEVGHATRALVPGDVAAGIAAAVAAGGSIVELSALEEPQLLPAITAVGVARRSFRRVSV